MSQPSKGKKHPGKAGKAHSDKNVSGTSGEKKGAEAAEKKPIPTSITGSSKIQTSGTSSVGKAQSASPVSSMTSTMKPSETKATSSQQQMSGVPSHKRKRNKKQAAQKAKTETEKAAQLTKPADSQAKPPSEEKQKDPGGAKSKASVAVEPKQPSTGKAASGQIDRSTTQVTSAEEPKAKSDKRANKADLATKAAVAAAGTAGAVTAAGLTAASAETKENKLATTTPAAAESKPSEKSNLDVALDDLIDTLGGPAENEPPSPAYTGPTVLDPMSSLYIEELGIRESTIPPEYRKLLESKGDGKVPPPGAESQPTMTDDDLADALSSDFTCSAVPPAGEKKVLPKEPAEEGDLVQTQSTTVVSSSAPPKEKKPKLEEEAISDSALDALVDTLGVPEPEPEEDLSSITEVEEPKAKERKEKKTGERDDTIPPEYRLTPATDKDGKPLLPEPEEKPKPISESDLIDEFSKDFVCPGPPTETPKPSKPADVSKKPVDSKPPKAPEENVTLLAASSVQPLAPSEVSTKPSTAKPKMAATEEVISTTAISSVKSSAPSTTSPNAHVPDEALEALSGSLGKIDPAPEETKPAVDKVKEKTKQEEHEKLGEDEETIPPDYRLTEAKDKDGKPLLPKPEEKPKTMSESELLDALSEGFSCSSAVTSKAAPAAAPQKSPGVGKPAVASTEAVISSASASAVHSSAPPPAATPDAKDLDAAADLLADSLGQREPDPDENKPVVDKIKEKAKSEHRDKLGERDDTIPPEYRHILDSDEKGKPTSKDGKKPKEQKKPADDSAAIDALSGDFDKCGKPPDSQQPPAKDEKAKSKPDGAKSKPVTKDEKKSKSSKKAKEQSSSAKSEKQKKS
ncbi:calpastatin isoform X3 [Hemicordylus capensis]|uniref:calpastatin isoform X3 n=1 Tax=Hemicordylus capensis TaxID=884348 RepID=UPI00230431E1|nr:calpastatin isoform X3 [Hemicordylus capensis]